MMIALLVAALIAVLGLIPLWHTVYNRYASTPTSSYSAPRQPEAEPVPILPGDRHQGSQPVSGPELGEPVVVWYNAVPSRFFVAHLHATSTHTRVRSECRQKAPSFGVQLTGQGEKV